MAPPILVLITLTSGRCDVAYWYFSDLTGWSDDVRSRGQFVSFRGPFGYLRSIEPLIAIVLACMRWKSAQAQEVRR
jgi:hypothetical protein